MMRKLLFIPLGLFVLLSLTLLWQLLRNASGDQPTNLESALIGKPVPEFTLPDLAGQPVTRSVLLDGKPHLLNVWATWCPTCRAEHSFLRQLRAQGIDIVGVNYKDDQTKALSWLETLGSPYSVTIADEKGSLGMDLGVYGAPETFLVDGMGIIRWRIAGALTESVWQQQLKRLWAQYSRQGAS